MKLVQPLCFLFLASLFAMSAQGQMYSIHRMEFGVGGTGQFTTSITDQTNTPHQATTDSAGFLLTVRDYLPKKYGAVELNYQYSSFSERFTSLSSQPLAKIGLSFHEATADYVYRMYIHRFQPYAGVGGGSLYFNPSPLDYRTQLRGTGLVELGCDIPTHNPMLGFRVQTRSLLYRAPNFNNSSIATSRWVATTEPSASVYLRF